MNRTEREIENLRRLRQAADGIARALCDGVKAGHPRKRLLATVVAQLRASRIRCPVCGVECPVMLLGREAARHIRVVARRSSFLTLRRRLEEQFERARLVCPSCAARAKDGPEADEDDGAVATGVADAAEEG